MKKLLAFLLLLSMCVVALGSAVQAEETKIEFYTEGDYMYTLLDDASVEIARYLGRAEKLEVPSELNGKRVKSIRGLAFEDTSVTVVTIPDCVEIIGSNPFVYCRNLKSILVSPDHPHFETIDGVLFNKTNKQLICYPYALTAVSYEIPMGTKSIGKYAFYNCSNLTSIKIPDSVEIIGDYAFKLCDNLRGIKIPHGVIYIGDSAFESCPGLAGITIPDSVTSIGGRAFAFCENLSSITIPNSVTSMPGNPFLHCENLVSIRISPDHPYLAIIDGVLFSKPEKQLICYPCALTMNSYVIPEGIKIIGQDAFRSSKLKNISIPDSVTDIGDYAFGFCSGLTSIKIPGSVTNIGEGAFYKCSNLIEIIIPNSVTDIGAKAFSSCSRLTGIKISESVISIGFSTFFGCKNLTDIIIPESVSSIEENAFYECKNLMSIIIPESVTNIGEKAFYKCKNLTSITIPKSVISIGESAFAYCENVTITVDRDSFAKQYCEKNYLKYTYPDANDWLTAP